jgi:predicted phosphodiesterase
MSTRMDWTGLDDVLFNAVRSSKGTTEAAKKVSSATGKAVNADQVSGAWRRIKGKYEGAAKYLGLPALDPVKPSIRRVICDGDNHYPIEDPAFQQAKIAFARDWKPDVWVNIGDHYDVYSLSSYAKDPARVFKGKYSLQAEFDSSEDYWRAVCEVTPGEIVYIKGNHEERLDRHVAANPGLHDLEVLELGKAANIPPRVSCKPYGYVHRIGDLHFEHGDELGYSGNPSQKYQASNKGTIDVIFGHHHRVGSSFKNIYTVNGPVTTQAHSQGHGSDVDQAGYIKRPAWSLGFTAIEFSSDGNFNVYPIVPRNGVFSFGGKVYDGRLWQ